MTESAIVATAQKLDRAATAAAPIEQLSLSTPFTVDTAYAIQAAAIEARYRRGEQLVGIKMGFTSRAKMEQMGVHDMIWGRLTDQMELAPGGILPMSQFIHPRAEPEICFQVEEPIDWELDLDEARQLVSGVAVAIEIIDSRYKDFKFSLEDVIADNCSSSAFVIGEWYEPEHNLFDRPMSLIINGQTVQSGSSKAILGNPWESVVNAGRLATQYGQVIPAGAYILAGAATPAVFLEPNQEVVATLEGFGSVSFRTA